MSAFERTTTVSRRTLLAGAAGAAVTAGLGGCGSDPGAEQNSASANQAATLPSYLPAEGARPDFPGTPEGVEAAYESFPSERRRTVPERPGNGRDTITGLVITYAAIPPAADRNSYWQGLNERLGITLDLQMNPFADYPQKFATTIAGNQLPDMVLTQSVKNFPALLEKRFAPLDEHLGGDAIRDYPNLANIPTATWRSVIYNGKIFGLPIPRGLVANYHFVRADLFEAAGVSTEPQSYAELVETGRALTDPRRRRWAYATIGQPRALLARVNGEPNVWREDGGTFTHAYETEEYKRSVSDLVELWKSGVLHPDAFNPAQPFKQLLAAGTVAINANDGYQGWNAYQADNRENASFRLGLLTVPQRDGGGTAPWALGPGSFGMAAITQADPERVKLCLRLANYLAAPFGSEEYLYITYGEQGVDHDVDARGNPSLTKRGRDNTAVQSRYLGDGPKAIYTPGRPEDAKVQHDYQTAAIANGVANPAVGLFSNTAAGENATADRNFLDSVNDLIQGRRPYSDLDGLVQTWRQAAGDGMRREYQDQLQQAGATPR